MPRWLLRRRDFDGSRGSRHRGAPGSLHRASGLFDRPLEDAVAFVADPDVTVEAHRETERAFELAFFPEPLEPKLPAYKPPVVKPYLDPAPTSVTNFPSELNF